MLAERQFGARHKQPVNIFEQAHECVDTLFKKTYIFAVKCAYAAFVEILCIVAEHLARQIADIESVSVRVGVFGSEKIFERVEQLLVVISQLKHIVRRGVALFICRARADYRRSLASCAILAVAGLMHIFDRFEKARFVAAVAAAGVVLEP